MNAARVRSSARDDVIEEYRLHDHDTGSPEVQVALLTKRIEYLTEHFKIHSQGSPLPPRSHDAGRASVVGARVPANSAILPALPSLIERLGLRR